MSLEAELQASLAQLEAQGLRREPWIFDGPADREVTIAGRRVLCFCSNNYLGLANHPQLFEAVERAASETSIGASASRLISGSHFLHRQAERALAQFVNAEDAVLFSSGYAANLGTIQALVGADDIVFSDALNHASLIDGCRVSRVKTSIYRHGDIAHLRELLSAERANAKRALILSDALFSMDGDFAELVELRALADEYDAALYVDEAHSLGVIGDQGKGLCAHEGVRADVLLGTLGKAFGCAGAFVAGSKTLCEWLRNRARSYVFSTAPSPLQAAAILSAVELVEKADDARANLMEHSQRIRRGLSEMGFEIPEGQSAIIPVIIGDSSKTMDLSANLFERGIWIQGIRPPTVAKGSSRLRLVPIATHTNADVDRLLEAFQSQVTNL